MCLRYSGFVTVISSARTQTGPALLILRDVLLCPLLIHILPLPNLVIAAHHTDQSSSSRSYRSSFSGVFRDSAAYCAEHRTTGGASHQTTFRRLARREWS